MLPFSPCGLRHFLGCIGLFNWFIVLDYFSNWSWNQEWKLAQPFDLLCKPELWMLISFAFPPLSGWNSPELTTRNTCENQVFSTQSNQVKWWLPNTSIKSGLVKVSEQRLGRWKLVVLKQIPNSKLVLKPIVIILFGFSKLYIRTCILIRKSIC